MGVCLRKGGWCDIWRVRVFQMEETAYLEARKTENTSFMDIKEVQCDRGGLW